MRIGICQLKNSTDVAANLEVITRSIADCAEKHARLALFPECALSGFSSKVAEQKPGTLEAALEQVAKEARRHRIHVLIPSAYVADDGTFANGAWLLSDDGALTRRFTKIGLTDSEAKFFAPGPAEDRSFTVCGRRFGLLFCREVYEDAWKYLPQPGSQSSDGSSSDDDGLDGVLWPAYWGWKKEHVWETGVDEKTDMLFERVKSWSAPLLQANFATDPSFTYPEDLEQGRSLFCRNDGSLGFRAPSAEVGSWVVDLIQ